MSQSDLEQLRQENAELRSELEALLTLERAGGVTELGG